MLSFFLIFIFIFFSSPAPTHAAGILDLLYPAIKINDSSRSPPGEAIAPEVPSDDTYSNTLEDSPLKCQSTVPLSKTWTPLTQQVGTDANGNPIMEEVPQDARDLKGEVQVKNLSNDAFRNFHLFFARGEIKCSEDKAKKSFTTLNATGDGASVRMTPYRQLLYYRSLLLEQAAQSLDRQHPQDLVTQDIQIAWSCGGVCQELSSKPSDSSCRPITLVELIFGLKDEDIYYSDPNTTASRFPDFILSGVQQYFAGNCSSAYGCYQNRFPGKAFSPLSKSQYKDIYKQLNFSPKGNVNSEVTVTRYDYNNATQTYYNPQPTTFDRTLPNAAALSSDQTQAITYLTSSAKSAVKTLPNSDPCQNVQTVSTTSIDQPPQSLIQLFINGLFKRLDAGETYTQSGTNDIQTTYDSHLSQNSQDAEKAFSNLIPASTLKEKSLLEKSFSSKSSSNANLPVPDLFYRGNLLYQTLSKSLRPASWQRSSL